ncbi:hypothetical protein SAMN03159341_101447 [Paenibacillus sp. 1_12]|uniref:hypothetical protein n=1 Tax=Paenibacillus sp. 1_12 TaxID=1566278 RepID=UPI0008EA769C|nr:hypothetical protein [Paenibacillus sp. 1_12]SFK75991.1 hypothetical protein SAMN03159341_101447 [Paenibacillus sp. 1_12]
MLELLISIVDSIRNEFMERENLEPAFGSVIYTQLGFGSMEHSGIYLLNGEVVELNGDGQIHIVSLKEFTGRLTTFNDDIYVPCYADYDGTIATPGTGGNALEMAGSIRNYNLLIDNCHQFCAGCVTGDFENSSNFLWMLKDVVKEAAGTEVVWKKWNWKKNFD